MIAALAASIDAWTSVVISCQQSRDSRIRDVIRRLRGPGAFQARLSMVRVANVACSAMWKRDVQMSFITSVAASCPHQMRAVVCKVR